MTDSTAVTEHGWAADARMMNAGIAGTPMNIVNKLNDDFINYSQTQGVFKHLGFMDYEQTKDICGYLGINWKWGAATYFAQCITPSAEQLAIIGCDSTGEAAVRTSIGAQIAVSHWGRVLKRKCDGTWGEWIEI